MEQIRGTGAVKSGLKGYLVANMKNERYHGPLIQDGANLGYIIKLFPLFLYF
ncbi:hypothetical protein AB3329_00075 [Streptococcus sp. H31]|uniref:hypothetical protein n=1 Tax=Streptococcus huangxiaojuni TaxID=3237239 RepID=UPI0034A33E68